MLYRSTLALSALLATAGVTVPSVLHSQVAVARRVSPATLELGALSRERAFRWVAAAPEVHCAPAPLTERPGNAEELARPRVAPLEATFYDAATAKRALARVTRTRVP